MDSPEATECITDWHDRCAGQTIRLGLPRPFCGDVESATTLSWCAIRTKVKPDHE